MTDNEIIQEATEAVEKNFNAGCYAGDLLRIIKEQKATIKEFDEKIVMQTGLIEYQKAEIERLQKKLDKLGKQEYDLCGKIVDLENDLKIAKSEAYREFAERFKQKYDKPLFYLGSYEQFMCEVDNLVKELTESNE